jgi:hypothetical protein
MSVKNEPAFPVTFTDKSGQIAPTFTGMTLRDWFAGHAPDMPDWWYQVFCGIEKNKAQQNRSYIMRGQLEAICEWRLEYANRQLAAREVKPK